MKTLFRSTKAIRRLAGALAVLAATAPVSAQVKWNPGHYVRIQGDTTTSGTVENTGIDHAAITGIIIRCAWKTLEPEKGV